ncbi:MAG: hypothetical protein QW270_08540 [Candidatus Bathyarchaeia archaeon]
MLKKIVLSITMGIAFSLAIFTVLTIMPCTQPTTPQPSPLSEGVPLSAINITLHISQFTEPQGLGSEANLTIEIVSIEDASNVMVNVSLPEGISLLEGDLAWTGNLTANVSSSFNLRIKAVEVGNWTISATAMWYLTSNSWYGDIDRMCICVFEDRIVVTSGECCSTKNIPPGYNELRTSPP